jgi:hypothetical protein
MAGSAPALEPLLADAGFTAPVSGALPPWLRFAWAAR